MYATYWRRIPILLFLVLAFISSDTASAFCSKDSDCPAGQACVGGFCTPSTNLPGCTSCTCQSSCGQDCQIGTLERTCGDFGQCVEGGACLPVCPNGSCEVGEDGTLCPEDCAAKILQSPNDIGIGPVEAGLGVGPGPGEYEVYLSVRSHWRYAPWVNDGGHEEWWCRIPDTAEEDCGMAPPAEGNSDLPGCSDHNTFFGNWEQTFGNFITADGVTVRIHRTSESGIPPSRATFRTVQGSLDNCDSASKWEWPSEGYVNRFNLPFTVRRTQRDIQLANFTYRVNWDGTPIVAAVGAQWMESDGGLWNDFSDWAYFNTGKMLTKCLQTSAQGQAVDLSTPEQNFYWHLCSEDGTCQQSFENSGPGGLHYNIAVFYYVSCTWSLPSSCRYPCCISDYDCPESSCVRGWCGSFPGPPPG